MKTTHTIIIVLLVICGVAAVFGGGALIVDPTGGKLRLSVELLTNSPFNNYLIPGLVLFLAIGILSIVAAILAMMRHTFAPRLTILLGTILCCWILIQVYFIQTVHPFHLVLGGIGFALYCLGLVEEDNDPVSRKSNFYD